MDNSDTANLWFILIQNYVCSNSEREGALLELESSEVLKKQSAQIIKITCFIIIYFIQSESDALLDQLPSLLFVISNLTHKRFDGWPPLDHKKT